MTDIQLQSLGIKSVIALIVVILIGPVVLGAVLQRQAGSVNHLAFWLVLVVAVIVFFVIFGAMRNRNAEFDRNTLFVHSTFYSFQISLKEITGTKVSSVKSSKDFGIRLNGVGLPGFRSGWFKGTSTSRVFVDLVEDEYLLLEVRGAPALVIGLADVRDTQKVLVEAIAAAKEAK